MKEESAHKKNSLFSEKSFFSITCGLSFVLGILYFYKGIKEGFFLRTWIVSVLNFIYIPVAFFFRKHGFAWFYLIYSVALVFITALHQSCLYNNFTCLLMIFVVIMIVPQFKFQSLALYFIAVTISFILNDEQFYLYLIHITRALWFYYIFYFVLEEKYRRTKLMLHDDEKKILMQLSKNRLQKSIQFEGYSESTIYRRLKAAMKRNRLTKQELIEKFKEEYHSELK